MMSNILIDKIGYGRISYHEFPDLPDASQFEFFDIITTSDKSWYINSRMHSSSQGWIKISNATIEQSINTLTTITLSDDTYKRIYEEALVYKLSTGALYRQNVYIRELVFNEFAEQKINEPPEKNINNDWDIFMEREYRCQIEPITNKY